MIFLQNQEILLASSSPRRKELLSSVGLRFESQAPDIEELQIAGESASQMVQRLALNKARALASKYPSHCIVAADTSVFLNDLYLGKPDNAADAERMLNLLQGREHQVWGAFALHQEERGLSHCEVHLSEVRFLPLSKGLVKAYVASGEPFGKAGAYAVQGLGAGFVSEIRGSYTNVVGLNLSALLQALRAAGVIEEASI